MLLVRAKGIWSFGQLQTCLHIRTIVSYANITQPDRIAQADNLISWDVRKPVKIRMGQEDPFNRPPILVQTMVRNTVQQYQNHPALAVKRNGKWEVINYGEYLEKIKLAAKSFLSLGLDRFQGVGIMGHNCPEWFISSVASIFAGGLSCGIYPTSSPDSVSYIGQHAPLSMFIVEDGDLYRKVLNGRKLSEALPHARAVIFMNPDSFNDPAIDQKTVFSWDHFLELGKGKSDKDLEDIEKQQTVNESCMLIYTSGTTGPPKGAMLSHDNVTYTSHVAPEGYEWHEEILISYLPMSHVAAHMIDCYMAITSGSTSYCADKNALKGTLVENLREIRPTRVVAVPRIFEKIQERLQEAAAQSSGLKKAISRWAKFKALEHHEELRRSGVMKETLGYKIAKKLVFNRIREALGMDRTIRIGVSSAPCSNETLKYFESLDLSLTNFYGATELTGPGLSNILPFNNKPGTVGYPWFGVQVKLHEPDANGNGEVICGSRNVFMGYHKDKKKTEESFTEDMWWKTGDLARVDNDGYYTITGRIKELIITSGGENIAPLPIEHEIKKELNEVVSNVVLVGEKRKFLSCLMTLQVEVDPETQMPSDKLTSSVKIWARKVLKDDKVPMETIMDFLKHQRAPELMSEIQKGIDRYNERAASNAQKVQKFTVLPSELSMDKGELGPTLKLKRFFVYEKYQQDIDNMYQE